MMHWKVLTLLSLSSLAVFHCAVAAPPVPAVEMPAAAETSSLAVLVGLRPADRGRGWQKDEIVALGRRLLGEPARFVEDSEYRMETWRRLAEPLPKGVDPELARALAAELNEYRGVDFALSESLERAWGLVPRSALERREDFAAGRLSLGSDSAGRITTSIYSLASWFFSADEARSFLSAVRRLDAERRIVALVDPALARELEPAARELDLTLLDTFGRGYSPWPRDPFAILRRPNGGVTFLTRPNLQGSREEDAFLAQELIQTLPAPLDRALGEPRWARAPRPFHNGQMLVTREDLWLTLHSVEVRTLDLLQTDRVPVETFNDPAGIERYVVRAELAAEELGEMLGRRARFVHPLPSHGNLSDQRALMRALAGGAGFDLDSLVTLLEPPGGERVALVGDLALGAQLARRLTEDEARVLTERYGLRGPHDALTRELTAAQETPRARALADFLDEVSFELRSQGWQLRRLPLVLVPLALRARSEELRHSDFLLTWNNVVLETREGQLYAEGFGSLLPTADAAAIAIFRQAGVELHLLPPLVRSVILGGGYRCASNHVRTPS